MANQLRKQMLGSNSNSNADADASLVGTNYPVVDDRRDVIIVVTL